MKYCILALLEVVSGLPTKGLGTERESGSLADGPGSGWVGLPADGLGEGGVGCHRGVGRTI